MVRRIGLVPNVEAEGTSHLYRAALIVTREANPHGDRYGRADTVDLTVDAEVHRMPGIGAAVYYGKDEAKVAALVNRHPAATMLVVLPKKATKGGAMSKVLTRMGERRVEVVALTSKVKPYAFDIGAGRRCEVVAHKDLNRPPQQQSAPSAPHLKPITPKTVSAPSAPHLREPRVPRPAPSAPREKGTRRATRPSALKDSDE